MIPVYSPYLCQNNLKYAHDALDSGWISSQGKYIQLAEDKLKEMLNVKHVLLTANGTLAMALVAKCLRYKYNFNTIIVPNSVYVAAWNVLLDETGTRLFVADSDLDTWNMDIKSLEKLCYNSNFCLLVNNLGNPNNIQELKNKFPFLTFVEDNCEGFGGEYNGKATGTESLCSALSFYGNKNITSGEGGAFVTNNDELYEYAKLIWGQGQSEEKFIHSVHGYNFRMTNVAAAILFGQLEHYDDIRSLKELIFDEYRNLLQHEAISFQKIETGCKHSNWMFGIRIKGNRSYSVFNDYMKMKGIETRPFFYPINKHPYLKCYYDNNINAALLSKEVVILPSYPLLQKEEIKYISESVLEYANEF